MAALYQAPFLTMGCSQVSVILLQTAQSWANTGVTEDGHCQGACRPQWFFTSQIETGPTLT